MKNEHVQVGEGHDRDNAIMFGGVEHFKHNFSVIKRFIEQIGTGEFLPVKIDVDIDRAPVNDTATKK